MFLEKEDKIKARKTFDGGGNQQFKGKSLPKSSLLKTTK